MGSLILSLPSEKIRPHGDQWRSRGPVGHPNSCDTTSTLEWPRHVRPRHHRPSARWPAPRHRPSTRRPARHHRPSTRRPARHHRPSTRRPARHHRPSTRRPAPRHRLCARHRNTPTGTTSPAAIGRDQPASFRRSDRSTHSVSRLRRDCRSRGSGPRGPAEVSGTRPHTQSAWADRMASRVGA